MQRITLIILISLCCTPAALAQYALQFGGAVAVSGDQVLAGEGRNLLLPGDVYTFGQSAEGTWVEGSTLSAATSAEGALGFGRALAASGTTLAVGAPAQGAVYLYTRGDDGGWTQQMELTSDADAFGSTLALDGDHLLVQSRGGAESTGQVHAYQRTGETWESRGILAPAEEEAHATFGSSLTVTGSALAVGAPGANERKGAAHMYSFDGTAWQPGATLGLEDSESADGFGSALALHTDEAIAIGAPGRGESGTVVLFIKMGSTWQQMGSLVPDEEAPNARFGSALAFGGDMLWVGAPGYDERRGAVYSIASPIPGTAVVQHQPASVQFRSGFGASIAGSEDLVVVGARGHDNFEGAAYMLRALEGEWVVEGPIYHDAEFESVTDGQVTCEEGAASAFPCSEVDMVSFLTRREIGARRGIQVNDVWGWEDPETGHEYALVGRTDGTSFVDLTDPLNPVFVGDLPKTATANQSLWRDIKVYKNHAFVVADGAGAHHMQVFDLTQLRDVTDPPVQFTETALYKGIYSSHNLVINEETGYAFAVGNSSGGDTCGGALHMINIQDPLNPTFAGCFADTRTGRGTGATHDAQCVTYIGPDADYRGREVCLSSNGSALSIADVTDKENPVAISIAEYPNVAYTHQGWLTEDHRYFFLNDEGDEASEVVDATRTLIFDLADLDDPLVASEYMGPSSAIDHNLYIRDNIMYQTNYVEGLRLIDVTDPENPVEIGHFDTVPYGPNDNSPVLGAWSNYPYFDSGIIVVTSGREGVFFLKKQSIDI